MWFEKEAWERRDWERCLVREGVAKLYVARYGGLGVD